MPDLLFWLIPLMPLFAAVLIGVTYASGYNRGEPGERMTSRIALIAALVSLLAVLTLDVLSVLQGSLPGHVSLATWFSSGEVKVSLSVLFDSLGLILTNLVALITFLMLKFSVNYMHREAGYQRFFMILSLFEAGMLLIVMAGNAVLTFVGWELAGVSSYLLIAYSYERKTATENANRAFITNRIGDAGFVLAIVLSFIWIGGVEWPDLLKGSEKLNTLQVGLIVASFMLAALAKSAQVPFSAWIARALEGPTPSSAVFYGSLMVHAGVYLLIRLQPLLETEPELMLVVAILGGLTALYGFFSGLVQTDVKSGLIFATTTQVGLMFLSCGMGWFGLASMHLVLHAIWRAYQFLSAPGFIHLVDRSARPVPKWLRGRRWLYIAALRRFWLDDFSDWLLVKPTRALARDTQTFDQQIVNQIVGLPGSAGAVSSLAQWERQKHAHGMSLDGDSGDVGRGRGVAGRTMEWVASLLYWFEEHLVLTGGDQSIVRLIHRIGEILIRVDELLSQPRYLLVLILITFVVIL